MSTFICSYSYLCWRNKPFAVAPNIFHNIIHIHALSILLDLWISSQERKTCNYIHQVFAFLLILHFFDKLRRRQLMLIFEYYVEGRIAVETTFF